MTDKFATLPDEVDAPARSPYAIVPSDTDELSLLPKGIYVGGGGNVTLRGVDSSADVTYRNLADGSYIAVRARFVRSTGTTATFLIPEA